MYVSLGAGTALNNANPASLDFTLVNKSLPWDYDFRFVIEEISNIDDKAQVYHQNSLCQKYSYLVPDNLDLDVFRGVLVRT